MSKIKVSAVSYTNSKAFVYGLEHASNLGDMALELDIPSVCARKVIDNQVDIGLIPVAALLHIPDYKIISPYCIGADGAVDSVFLFSNKPIEEVKSIRLDSHSQTSNNLCRVLVKNHWQIQPQFQSEGNADAFVLIGDRTFGKKTQYPFHYDLAAEWKLFTGLPFAFAVWAANKTMPEDFVGRFNEAVANGLNHRHDVIRDLPNLEHFDYEQYLFHSLDYDLDSRKMEAMQLFLELIKKL